ncbi:class I SAM-dependent methyltransferase [Desulfovibrio sp. TomC]|uniref:class I SAM-dependent methyltransferase n=1 Tax=Desulfovibrio sp. TomC TaxID=1562888 RepID=UPI0005B84BC6|nr:class I SAM-dependent methyltransferase [Desulfovibrio sp. TomC]
MTQASEQFDPTAHFDEDLAGRYDRRIRLFCPSYDALHHMIASLLSPIGEHARLLAAGVGTGAEIVNLGRLFPFWTFVGVDISSDMLSACRRRVSEAGIGNRAECINSRLQEYQSPLLFDAAISVFVAHFIKGHEEKIKYFRAIAENLKPGGTFVLADLHGDTGSDDCKKLLDAWLFSYALQGVSTEQFAKDKEHILRDVDFVPERELYALLTEAGFTSPVRFYQTFLFGGWVATKPC